MGCRGSCRARRRCLALVHHYSHVLDLPQLPSGMSTCSATKHTRIVFMYFFFCNYILLSWCSSSSTLRRNTSQHHDFLSRFNLLRYESLNRSDTPRSLTINEFLFSFIPSLHCLYNHLNSSHFSSRITTRRRRWMNRETYLRLLSIM